MFSYKTSCDALSLNLALTRQVRSSWLHQAVASLSIKQTICLSPWVPTQQTLRAGREAAWGPHSVGAISVYTPENVNQDLTRFKNELLGIFSAFPQIINCCHWCSVLFIYFWLGAHMCLGKNVITEALVHTTIQNYTDVHKVWKQRAECDIWQRPTSQKHFSLSASSTAARSVGEGERQLKMHKNSFCGGDRGHLLVCQDLPVP